MLTITLPGNKDHGSSHAVHLSPKATDVGERWRQRAERVAEARKSGRRFRNSSDEDNWPKDEIFMFLRARTRTLNPVTTCPRSTCSHPNHTV